MIPGKPDDCNDFHRILFNQKQKLWRDSLIWFLFGYIKKNNFCSINFTGSLINLQNSIKMIESEWKSECASLILSICFISYAPSPTSCLRETKIKLSWTLASSNKPCVCVCKVHFVCSMNAFWRRNKAKASSLGKAYNVDDDQKINSSKQCKSLPFLNCNKNWFYDWQCVHIRYRHDCNRTDPQK